MDRSKQMFALTANGGTVREQVVLPEGCIVLPTVLLSDL